MNLIFFYKGSEGELHVGLPIIYELKKVDNNLNVVFVFEKKSSYDNLHISYKKLIDEMGVVKVGMQYLIPLALKTINQKTILMTCTNGHTTGSFFMDRILLNSRMTFFHHAYAFAGIEPLANMSSRQETFNQIYSSSCREPVVFLNRENDRSFYLQLGFKEDSFFISGFPGYSQEWLSILQRHMGGTSGFTDTRFSKVVLVAMRDMHASYLTKENFEYQLDAIFWIAEKLPHYQFILKPHPRQKNLNLLKERSDDLASKNVIIRYESILFLTSLCDIVVSYWSSAIVDAVAVGKPVIEFHRHKVYHPQLVKIENNQLVSIYSKLGFCETYTEKEDVLNFLQNSEGWESYLKKIKQNFHEQVLINTGFAEKFLIEVSKKENKDFNFYFCYIKNIIDMILYKILLKPIKIALMKSKMIL